MKEMRELAPEVKLLTIINVNQARPSKRKRASARDWHAEAKKAARTDAATTAPAAASTVELGAELAAAAEDEEEDDAAAEGTRAPRPPSSRKFLTPLVSPTQKSPNATRTSATGQQTRSWLMGGPRMSSRRSSGRRPASAPSQGWETSPSSASRESRAPPPRTTSQRAL